MQLDLFAAPTRPAPPPRLQAAEAAPTLASLLPARSLHWDRRVAAAGHLPLEVMVCGLWTGEVLEVLSLPDARTFLHHDGVITDRPRDGRAYRLVFLTAKQLRPIAARVKLAPLGAPGTAAIRLAEADTAWPDLAEWLDGIEAADPKAPA